MGVVFALGSGVSPTAGFQPSEWLSLPRTLSPGPGAATLCRWCPEWLVAFRLPSTFNNSVCSLPQTHIH